MVQVVTGITDTIARLGKLLSEYQILIRPTRNYSVNYCCARTRKKLALSYVYNINLLSKITSLSNLPGHKAAAFSFLSQQLSNKFPECPCVISLRAGQPRCYPIIWTSSNHTLCCHFNWCAQTLYDRGKSLWSNDKTNSFLRTDNTRSRETTMHVDSSLIAR